MFGGYRNAKQTDADAVGMVDGTLEALKAFPAWAIEEGCHMIHADEVPEISRRFPPNDPEIAQVIAGLVKPYRRALEETVALLQAPVERKLPAPKAALPSPQTTGAQPPDGKHGARVQADIAARAATRKMAEEAAS